MAIPAEIRSGRGAPPDAGNEADAGDRAASGAVAPADTAAAHDAADAGPAQTSGSVSVARGALALLSSQPLTWAASLLAAALVPRYLGDVEFGQYSVAVTVAALLGVAVLLGVPDYVRRRVAADASLASSEGTASLVLVTGLSIVVSALAAALLPLFGLSSTLTTVMQISLAGLAVSAAHSVLTSLMVAQERHARFAWLNAAGAVTTTLVGVAVLLAGGRVVAFTVAGLFTQLIFLGFTWLGAGLKPHRDGLSPRLWLRMARGGLPFMGWLVALTVRARIDILIIGFLMSAQAAGWLAAAYRIVSITIFIPTLVTTPLLPALTRQIGDPDGFRRTFRRSLVMAFLLSTAASAVIMALAPAWPQIMGWGPEFDATTPLIAILAIDQPLVAVTMVMGITLIALYREHTWLWVAVAGAAFKPAASFVAIPIFERLVGNGAIGAAVVEVATETVMLCGALLLMPRGLIDRATLGTMARVLLAAAGLVAVTWLLRPVSLPLALVAGGIVFGGGVLVLRVLRPSELWLLFDTVLRPLDRRLGGRLGRLERMGLERLGRFGWRGAA